MGRKIKKPVKPPVDMVWEQYIAGLRTLIDTFGSYNAIHCMELALELNSEEAGRTEQEKARLKEASRLVFEAYDKLEEWEEGNENINKG